MVWRQVETIKLEVLLLQEIIIDGDKIVKELTKMFGVWDICYVDAKDRFGGFVTG